MALGGAATLTERSCAALRVVREFTALLQRTALVSAQLDPLHSTALALLATRLPLPPHRALDPAHVERMGLAGDWASADADALAKGALRSIAALSDDPVIGKQARPACCAPCERSCEE